jgi:hypothetical protein
MKSSQLEKLYSKLTPTELGTLAFGALARKDVGEAEIILNNVERHTYRSVHADYRQRIESLILLASCTAWNTGKPVP